MTLIERITERVVECCLLFFLLCCCCSGEEKQHQEDEIKTSNFKKKTSKERRRKWLRNRKNRTKKGALQNMLPTKAELGNSSETGDIVYASIVDIEDLQPALTRGMEPFPELPHPPPPVLEITYHFN